MKAWSTVWLVSLLWSIAALHAAAAEPSGSVQPAVEAPRQVLVLLNLPPAHFRPQGGYSGGYSDLAASAARRRLVQSLARAHGLTLAIAWPMPVLGVDCYVIEVPATQDLAAVTAELGRDPRVAWTQPMNNFRGLSDDPLYKLQPAARAWRLDELHEVASGRQVRVAIVDSKVQFDHPDLLGQVALSLDLTTDARSPPEDHGTAVAGIVAAVADNRVGIAGVAPRARLLALRACRQAARETWCDTLGLARALDAAIDQGAQVINLSLGGPRDRLIQRLVEAALARGICIVAAVDPAAGTESFPAAIGGVISVTDRASASRPGESLIAPGTDIPTTLSGSRWALVSGSSYAAAHVSGLAALLVEVQATRGQVRALTDADFVRRPDGQVDACASLARAARACTCDCDDAASLASKTTP